MYHEYPYTTYFHDIDKMCECLRQVGYRLEVDANALKLIDSKGNVLSTVVISYSEKALTDIDGTAIKSYILEAATGETTLVLTKGNGQSTVLTLPFATKAERDILNKNLTAYAYSLSAVGNKLVITKGDGTTYEVLVPFATAAATDINNKNITTYAATLAVDGNNLVLKDSENHELARITSNYATNALNDADGDEISSTYAATLEAGTTTVILKAKDGNTLSTITVPFSTTAASDQQGNNFISDYAEKIVVDGDGKRIGLEAHDGTRLATITVPFATEATNATNAIQQVQIQGDQIVFTTYGGQSFTITSPYSVKSQRDDANNIIKTTYVARVENNPNTGAIEFYDAVGNLITSLTPTVTAATTDNYGNNIADYIKQIVASSNSNYVTVTHGDGTVDTITLNYSTTAWKDTNNNVIKNTYIKRLACVEDVDDGHYKLVAYNGDTPEAELFRIEIYAYAAQTDVNGRALTSYVGEVSVNASDNIDVKDGEGNTLKTISGKVTTTPAGTVSQPSFTGSQMTSTGSFTPAGSISGTAVDVPSTTVQEITGVGTLPSKAADTFVAPSMTYVATTETITFNPGSFTEGAFSAGTLPTSASKTVGASGAATVTDGTFTGIAGSVSVNGTPSGTVSQPTFTGTQTTEDVVFDD